MCLYPAFFFAMFGVIQNREHGLFLSLTEESDVFILFSWSLSRPRVWSSILAL